jgi:hypothetical protein
MNIVFFLSYLCTFLLGGIATLLVAYFLINRWDKKENATYDAAKDNAPVAQVDLAARMAPYN